jgi:hypothetical protein
LCVVGDAAIAGVNLWFYYDETYLTAFQACPLHCMHPIMYMYGKITQLVEVTCYCCYIAAPLTFFRQKKVVIMSRQR